MIKLLSVLNFFRGRGKLPKYVFIILSGILAFFSSGLPQVGIIVSAGIGIWCSFAWGSGLMAISGRDTRDEHENPHLYHLTNAITDSGFFPLNNEESRIWGAVYMALRGLYITPLFAGLAGFYDNGLILLIGTLGFLQGPIYYISGKFIQERNATAIAEAATGLYFGCLIFMAIQS